MSLGEDTIEGLKHLLRRVTALVFVDGKPVGTAFFISEDLLLTCEHVVKDKTVMVKLVDGEPCPADVIATDPADLALLRCHRAGGEPPACAVLDRTLFDGACLVAGFPSEKWQRPGLEVYDVRAHPRTDYEGGDQVLEIEAGVPLTYGISGGPVVSARSGAVIGIIRYSKDAADALGGGAIPVGRAADAFGPVARIMTESILAMVPWRDVLGPDHWQQLGKKSWATQERVDLKVSGGRDRWLISLVEAADPGLGLTGPDLGEEVAEAIFHWAQRRHTRGADEVALLGRLLASALFPQSMAQRLRVANHADSIVVRLHVEHGNDLADIPWELAAVPGERGRFLAADPQFRFVRVVDDPAVPVIAFAPKAPASVRVLAAVAQPATWKFPEVHGVYKRAPYEWPDAAKMSARLCDGITRNGFTADVPASMQYSGVRYALQNRPYDVLHYVGTGQWGLDGKAVITFLDDEGGESWEDVSNVLDTARRAGVRLVVLELMLPPAGENYLPLTLRALSHGIGGSVNAAVLTNLPVHPQQCIPFNDRLYEKLSNGESIAAAVQLARNKVMYDRPVEDAAGFGWFTIVTGPQSDVSLVSRHSKNPTQTGAQQLGAADRDGDTSGEPPALRNGDVLHR